MKNSYPERTYSNPCNEGGHREIHPDHWERYEFAATFAAGLRVLDIACGSGYGSALLAQSNAAEVTGADIDPGAIDWAGNAYGRYARFVRVEPAKQLPFEDGCFDLVVSFETVEHVAEPQEFCRELVRILRPGGTLIISTPLNESETRFSPPNPFHLREYSWAEFSELVEPHVSIVDRFSQIAAMSEQWSAMKSSSAGPFVKGIARLIPAGFKRRILARVQAKPGMAVGKIKSGMADCAAVQILVCRRDARR